MGELKQLQFVPTTITPIVEYAEKTYTNVKSALPGLLLSPVSFTEKLVSPYVVKGQSLAYAILVSVDEKVDFGVTKSQDFYNVGAEKTRTVVGESAVDQFQDAKEKYVAVVSDTFQFVRENGVVGSAKAAISRRGEVVDVARGVAAAAAGTVVSTATGTVDYVQKQPIVQKAISVSKPYAEFAQAKFFDLLNFFLALPLYATIYSLFVSVFASFKENAHVKSVVDWGKTNIYPSVKFAADPVVETTTPYVSSFFKIIEPKTAPKTNSSGDVDMAAAAKETTAKVKKGTTQATKQAKSEAKDTAAEVQKSTKGE